MKIIEIKIRVLNDDIFRCRKVMKKLKMAIGISKVPKIRFVYI